MNIGQAIKVERVKKGLKQKDLLEWCGLSKSWLSQVENCRAKPSKKCLESIAEVLDVTTDYLLQEAERY